MKNQFGLFAILMAAIVFSSFTLLTDNDGFYRIDNESSTVIWSGSKITGKTHSGTVKLLSGGLQLNGGFISNGKFTIDMTSLVCTDIEDAEMNQKLLNHLKSEDFFAVSKFKTANVSIISVDNNGNVTANLTIKGITKKITFPATVTVENGVLKADANIEVDRLAFDVRYGSDSFFDNLGNKAIDNIIKFKVSLVSAAG